MVRGCLYGCVGGWVCGWVEVYVCMCKSRRDLPWITPQIIRLIRKRDKMYTKLKHLNTSTTSKQLWI